MARAAINTLLSFVGAAIGAAVGVQVFVWLLGQGLYAMILPGACLGLGANLASRDRSPVRGLVLGILGLAVGLGTEWWHRPFNINESLSYFLSHLASLQPWTLTMIATGGALAFWWGMQPAPWASPKSVKRAPTVPVNGPVPGERD